MTQTNQEKPASGDDAGGPSQGEMTVIMAGDRPAMTRAYSVSDEAMVDLALASASRGIDPTTTVTPPSDEEKFHYLRRSRRWVLPLQTALFLPVVFSLARFAVTSPWLYVFLAWITLQLLSAAVGMFSSNQRHRVTLKSHHDTVSSYQPEQWPSVDVFLPTAGEPLEVLMNTYQHVSRLSHPGEVNVHVLDDGNRGEVAAAAERFGFNYIVRPDRGVLKKAGNLRHGFTKTDGDLILVLDADFVPRPDMVSDLVPYFADETVGIVQSPQYFDTTQKQNWLQRCAGATQELFYRWVQPSRDGLGVAICVGTSAMYRRAGLEAASGFAEIEHSEDVHTGVKLRKVGFGLRYVPVLLSKGLCPSEVKPFISQQYRWATGSLSLMKDKSFYREANVGIKRLLPYASGFLYYITTGFAVFVSMLPGPIMMWFFPDRVTPMNYLPFVGGPIVWFLIMPFVSVGRWRVEVLRVQVLYSFAHAKALWDTLRGRTAGWVPTGAEKVPNPLATTVMRMIRVMVPLNVVGLTTGVLHVTVNYGLQQVWPAAIYAALYVYITGPLLMAPRVLSWRDIPSAITRRRRGRRRARSVTSTASQREASPCE